MKELSLNILDIAENSVKAGAEHILIRVADGEDGRRILTIRDDGSGMTPDFLARVTDPFTTTRTTRPVGLGLPLLKLAAEQTGGALQINSRHESLHPEDHGTEVIATFDTRHLDCQPLGDLASTIMTLLQGHPDVNWRFEPSVPAGEQGRDTAEMKEILGDIPLNDPEVLLWARDYWNQSPEEEEA